MKLNGIKKRKIKTYTFQPTEENYIGLSVYKRFGEKSKTINKALALFLKQSRASNNEKKSKVN